MMRIGAAGCGTSLRGACRHFWLCARRRPGTLDCHGKEGVAGSSPAEGSPRKARYSASRMTSTAGRRRAGSNSSNRRP